MAKVSTKFITHTFSGGWATDFGYTAYVPVQGNRVEIPWLNDAENLMYELDGAPHKVEGMSKNFTSDLGATILGVFDCWFTGTGATPTQHRILHVGTLIMRDNANNTFTNLITGMTANSIPDYTVFEDLLIMANADDVPKSWDGASAIGNLAGSPPKFSYSTVHKQRCWAAGVLATPSTLYYSVANDPADWAGGGSGNITIDPDDGDSIKAIIPHRNDLWVFKGEKKGSIHRITGSAPTGADAFARVPFASGIGAVCNNAVTSYANDIAFLWQDDLHTISTTNEYGDFKAAALSTPIHDYLHENLNRLHLSKSRLVNWQEHSLLLLLTTTTASTTPNVILAYDYRFSPGRWAKWSAFSNVHSLAPGYDPTTGFTHLLAGCSDGFLRTIGTTARNIDTTLSIPMTVRTPYLQYNMPEMMKQFNGGSLVCNPKTPGVVQFGWTRDADTKQTEEITIASSGVKLDTFVLDTDRLSNARYFDAFFRAESGGEFRAIQYSLENNVLNEDVEIHSIGAAITPVGESYEAI